MIPVVLYICLASSRAESSWASSLFCLFFYGCCLKFLSPLSVSVSFVTHLSLLNRKERARDRWIGRYTSSFVVCRDADFFFFLYSSSLLLFFLLSSRTRDFGFCREEISIGGDRKTKREKTDFRKQESKRKTVLIRIVVPMRSRWRRSCLITERKKRTERKRSRGEKKRIAVVLFIDSSSLTGVWYSPSKKERKKGAGDMLRCDFFSGVRTQGGSSVFDYSIMFHLVVSCLGETEENSLLSWRDWSSGLLSLFTYVRRQRSLVAEIYTHSCTKRCLYVYL